MVDVDVIDGSSAWSNNGLTIISMSDSVLPNEIALSAAYPNPFNPSTSFMYDISSDLDVSIAIYDIRGRLVTELVNEMQAGAFSSYKVTVSYTHLTLPTILLV